MKRGPVILTLCGLGLLAFLFFSPVTPDKTSPAQAEEVMETKGEATSELSPNERVDEALRQLESGELPPMQAVLKIRTVSEEHPENVKANFTLGLMSIQTGQLEKAAERFGKVIEVEPKNAEAHRHLAQVQINLGQEDKAKENYKKALSLTTDPSLQKAIEQEMKEFNIN